MNSEYIEMCKSATEIQELWEPKIGDRVTYKGNVAFIDGFFGTYDDSMEVTLINWEYSLPEKLILLNKILWLPRQEDLQKIYNDFVKGNGLALHHDFNEYVNKTTTIAKQKLELSKLVEMDLTSLWLCFVMEKCFNKFWNAETKSWDGD
jgi:hypothetical protein